MRALDLPSDDELRNDRRRPAEVTPRIIKKFLITAYDCAMRNDRFPPLDDFLAEVNMIDTLFYKLREYVEMRFGVKVVKSIGNSKFPGFLQVVGPDWETLSLCDWQRRHLGERKCLRCGIVFKKRYRFNFMCEDCLESINAMAS